ncbi:MAG: hypothetical protein GXP27_14415 [Planctomycetes bacterium]|nr:hypothetical protein [Planctomycetota bacterium]
MGFRRRLVFALLKAARLAMLSWEASEEQTFRAQRKNQTEETAASLHPKK